ncbi:elongation of very long chain fatty acids protein 6-like [Corythoichthys intestinalis]|uniref:elongation of very long chain fatty acids protein 6-like n=1 Tax=Corythoichthys intestinalis TaxID=161448 RepID=UPI0025A4F361|nr:elongation of very long chain fatty acids protein 6-like [Corythoichthys intestinalis]
MAEGNITSKVAGFDFEKNFDFEEAQRWMADYWATSLVISALYAALVFGGQRYMRFRPKLDLRRPLFAWSLTLALFSAMGAARTGRYALDVLNRGGWRRSVCEQGFYDGPVSKFWAFAFAVSKVPELGDTAFVVLRKQRLIFLHWYHHATVLPYSWFSYKEVAAGGGWFMTINYAVHALMYSYYACRAGGLRVPRLLAALLTAAQLTQMVAGLAVSGLTYHWTPSPDCKARPIHVAWGALLYLSYLLLFARFFYQAYLRPRSKTL